MTTSINFHDQPNIIRQQALTNHDFTIISSNCLGAMMYHELGHRFDSPTINLFMMSQDYLHFIENLSAYLSAPSLVEDPHAGKSYPVGVLSGDGLKPLRLYFVHYDNFALAKEKWNERKQRIHPDNMYYVYTDMDGATEEDLQRFDHLPFKNKVILTGVPHPELKCAYQIKNCEENGHLGSWYAIDNYLGKRYFEQFNFVQFLNQR